MKINRPFILFSIFLVFFAGPALLFATGRPVDEPDAEPVDDGLPLLITRETDQLLAAFLALRAQQEELPARSLGSVGFISLNRQSHAFRGKIIELNGRLLQTRQLLADFNGQNGFNSLYESWMLLDDEKRIPVRLLSTSVPQEILASLPNNSGANPADNAGKFEITQKGEYGPLRIHAYASYYRLTSYSDGQDFYNAPTALALSFSLSPTASQPGDSSPNINDTKAINQIKQKSQIEQVEQTSQTNSDESTSPESTSPEQAPTDLAPDELRRILLHRFREQGPLSLLPPDRDVTDWPTRATRPMTPVWLHGTLTHAEKVEDPSDAGLDWWQCQISSPDSARHAIVETPSIPAFTLTSDAHKTSPAASPATSPATVAPAGPVPNVSCLALFLKWQDQEQTVPVLLTPNLRWYPQETLLGRLKMDVAALEAVPVYSPTTLQPGDPEPADPERTTQGETDARSRLHALRLTDRDRYPFYELLAALRNASPGFLRAQAEEERRLHGTQDFFPVVELFNRPEQYQGTLLLLRGIVRRATLVLVNDRAVRAHYGLDHYYQLYLYTGDSQGNPLVICVPELPPGMTTGTEEHYRVAVTLAGFFYKTWAYKAGRKSGQGTALDASETSGDASERWVRVPLILGSDVQIMPEETSGEPFPFPLRFFWLAFWTITILYIAYRIARRRWR